MLWKTALADLFGPARRRPARRVRTALSFVRLEDRAVPAVVLTAPNSTFTQDFDTAFAAFATTPANAGDTNSFFNTPNSDALAAQLPSSSDTSATLTLPGKVNGTAVAGGLDVYLGEEYSPFDFFKVRNVLAGAGDAGAPLDQTAVVPSENFWSAGLYSLGTVATAGSTAGSADRSLGLINSNSTGNHSIGVQFKNSTGSAITSLNVSYTGEQWLDANTTAQNLRFFYSVNATDYVGGGAADYIEVPTLKFTTPKTAAAGLATTPNGYQDGSAASNRATLSATIGGLNIPDGATFFVKWVDPNADGIDAAVALDDISIQAVNGTPGVGAGVLPAVGITATTGTLYSQNFDGLASTGSPAFVPSTGGSPTLAGWSALSTRQSFAPDSYLTSDGSSNAGALFSFGAATGATVTDRALGSIGSNNATAGSFDTFVRLRNDTAGTTFNSLQVQYTGEQWRYGGTAINTAAGQVPQTLQFQYSLNEGQFWVDVPALNFASKVNSGTAGKRDGNAAANRQTLTAVIDGIGATGTANLGLAPGGSILLRWVDRNDSGNDNGLAVDDLFVSVGSGTGADLVPVDIVTGGSYTETFDGLANKANASGVADFAWQQGATAPTLAGWFSDANNAGAAPLTYQVSNGSNNAGGLYSFGVAGTNPLTDRALGSVGSGNDIAGGFTYGVALRNANTTTASITKLDVSYTLEQWRVANNLNPNRLIFEVSTDGGATFVEVNSLSAEGPQPPAGGGVPPVASSLDGNDPANQVVVSDAFVLPTAVAPGGVVLLRWRDPNNQGSDHGLAIDDVNVTPI